MINKQPKEKPFSDPLGRVQIHSIFHTIQGEGPFAGNPSVFIRLAGCNLDCPMCDTIYTGDDVKLKTPETILEEVKAVAGAKTKLIVITGGEPFRQDFSQVVMALHDAGFIIQIETNGTLYLEEFPYVLTTLVCSPKIGKIHKDLIPYIRHYKYVARADNISLEDGLPIEVLGNKSRKQVARPPYNLFPKIYLQPEDSQDPVKNKANLEAVVKSCMIFGHTLCVQIHKIIGVD